jgi:outer membrane protein assembly factor BamB
MTAAMKQLSLALVLVCAGSTILAAQWPQWRGPSRDGVVPAASVPAAWPEKLALKWRQQVGEGYASPVVAGGRVFIHSRRDPEEIVSAFDLASGKPVWSDRYQSAFTKSKYAGQMSKGPFSTPLVADGRVYTLGTSAVLSALDAATGAVTWRLDWSKDVDTSKLFTGTAMSPVIDGGILIVHVGDDTKGIFRGLDPATGREKWSLPGHGPGYASPVLLTIGGTRQFVTLTDSAVVGVEVATGRELWQVPFPDEWHENIVTPVVAGDILVVSGKQKGTFGYRISPKGAAFAATEVWRNADLPMYMSSPVTDGSFIYGFGHKRKGQLFCLDARTGVARWTTEGRGGTNAAIQSAGDNLLVLMTDGVLQVLKRSPGKFEEVRRYTVAESETWAHPVLLGREIVVRDADSVAVWSIAQ